MCGPGTSEISVDRLFLSEMRAQIAVLCSIMEIDQIGACRRRRRSGAKKEGCTYNNFEIAGMKKHCGVSTSKTQEKQKADLKRRKEALAVSRGFQDTEGLEEVRYRATDDGELENEDMPQLTRKVIGKHREPRACGCGGAISLRG